MDSYTNRGNTIFSCWTTCLGLFACLNHLTYYGHSPDATGFVEMAHLEDMTVNHQFDADQLNIGLDMNADLTSEFHWNMKMLFAYVVAEYETPKNARNFVTIWDMPIKSAAKAKLTLNNVLNEYPIRDQFRLLKARNIKLQLRYRTIPITGFLLSKEMTVATFTTPTEYFRKQDDDDDKKAKKEKKRVT